MKTGFFQENPGENSVTRLAFFAMIITALFIAIYQVINTGTIDVVGFTTIAGMASGLKLVQKNIENKN